MLGLLLAPQVSFHAPQHWGRSRTAVLGQILHLITKQQTLLGWDTVGTRGGGRKRQQQCVIPCSSFRLASLGEHGVHPLSVSAGALQETPGWLPPSRARLLRLPGQGEERGQQGRVLPNVGLLLLGEAQRKVQMLIRAWFRHC